ncbi:serine acetyltransferase [Methylomonas sp. EFPC3]|uniref:serine O-acetyltransferase EpsC n=1 Tax=Methylomonas sp. EFPC3 TaxID=3021710 RepID=UPI002415ACF4|nr:serine O-acetyltransferase EpsC [Methylomonas sp. EFPC3]WFP51109.1 serine acetyltransferase [Methylomonas sp. EFPC3]
MNVSDIGYGWGIDALVAELRDLRVKSLEDRRRREHPPKLPSRKVLGPIIDSLGAVLFPNRLGQEDLNDEGIDYFVGHTLDSVLRKLNWQVALELRFVAEQNGSSTDVKPRAVEITREFAKRLPKIRLLIDSDIQAAYEGDPAARSSDEVLVCYPGITASIHHRVAHELYNLGAPLVARVIAELAHSATGIDIHPGAQIADCFFIDHGTGVVIGETAVIGSRVRVYQAVTLGAKRFEKDDSGMLVKGNARHPIVEDDVVIYAGATILGRITIGKGSIIGGNVWLTHSVPPGSHVSQGQTRTEIFAAGGGI